MINLESLFGGNIDTTSTINSLKKAGNYYQIEYSGDYNELLDWVDDQFTGGNLNFFKDFHCSLFTARGDLITPLSGRNFDNPPCDVLVGKYNPPDGFASLAFTRISDLGYSYGTNYLNLTFNQKLSFLLSPYFAPDGINEHGVIAGLASVAPVQYNSDPTKDTIFVTRLIREILDHAQNIEDALDIANLYNVFDGGVGVLSHHVLVADPSGQSMSLEFANGEFRAVQYPDNWHVITNIPVYNIPVPTLKNSCWRFNTIYNFMDERSGNITWQQGMEVLNQVHLGTPWSAIYDHFNKGIFVCIDAEYDNVSFVDIENYNTVNYGRFELQGFNVIDYNLNGILESSETSTLELSISAEFDSPGVNALLSTEDNAVQITNNQGFLR